MRKSKQIKVELSFSAWPTKAVGLIDSINDSHITIYQVIDLLARRVFSKFTISPLHLINILTSFEDVETNNLLATLLIKV